MSAWIRHTIQYLVRADYEEAAIELGSAFVWADTPQGEKYWCDLRYQLEARRAEAVCALLDRLPDREEVDQTYLEIALAPEVRSEDRADALDDAFYWAEMPPGQTYWQGVHDTLNYHGVLDPLAEAILRHLSGVPEPQDTQGFPLLNAPMFSPAELLEKRLRDARRAAEADAEAEAAQQRARRERAYRLGRERGATRANGKVITAFGDGTPPAGCRVKPFARGMGLVVVVPEQDREDIAQVVSARCSTMRRRGRST